MRRFDSTLQLGLALFAAAASVASPLLAYPGHAGSARAGAAEVCTAARIKRIPVEPGDERKIPGERSHCCACVTSTGAAAPARARADLLVPAGREAPLPARRAAATPVEPIRAARPRGPPVAAFSV
jgi:hypothetical protein